MSPGPRPSTISILYVDDDPILLELGKVFLERSGNLSVDTISSGHQAIDMVDQKQYDAIISDYEMPQMDGIALLQKIRECHGEIPFVLFTGRGREEVVIKALNCGADSYLQKGGNATAQFVELENTIKKHVERRKAEIALEISEQKYRLLVDNAQEGICVLQHEIVVFHNPKFVDLFQKAGAFTHEMLTQSIFDSFHPDDQEMMRERFHRRINYGEIFEGYPFRVIDSFGAVHWFEVHAVMTEWNGNPATLNFIRDITEQHNLKSVISENETRYQELINSLPKTILEINEDLNLTFINRAGLDIFGYEIEDLHKPLSAMDLVIQSDKDKILSHKIAVTQGKSVQKQEYTALTKDGRTFPMKTYLSSVFRKNKFAGFRAVCIDITEEKIAKYALAKANVRLNLMTSVTRHDILNKITVLQSLLDLSHEESDESTRLEYLKKQQEITEVIQEYIEFTKYYQEVGMQTPKWHELEKIIPNATYENELGIIFIEISVKDYLIYADPLIIKIFLNIFENSVNHGCHVTRICICCQETREGLTIVYSDDGIGVPSEIKEKIFGEGFGKHTGFGLFLTREILSITGISIRENGIEGCGARFEILVPKGGYRINSDTIAHYTS